jgi:hypothetical protein
MSSRKVRDEQSRRGGITEQFRGPLAERGAIRSQFLSKVAMIAARDGVAGLVSSVVLIANIVSFGALMFPGELSPGVPVAIWSMLIGSCVCGIWIAGRRLRPVCVQLRAVRRRASACVAGPIRQSCRPFGGALGASSDRGDAIQIYWLSGFIFFGSSERAFDRVRSEIGALPDRTAGYVILDFSLVSGADLSAIVSLSKLRKFCDQHRVVLAYSALPPATQTALELRGFFTGKRGHRAFHDLNAALAWCEEKVLADAQAEPDTSLAGFESWLHKQLGGSISIADLMTYLQRKDLWESEIVYREGEPADTVDLVAAGNLAINVAAGDGVSLNVRRITTHTVVGEMGFFRQVARSATVEADGPVTLFTLTRRNFERMRRERPDLASAFDDFIMRTLADRIDFANRTVAALSRS